MNSVIGYVAKADYPERFLLRSIRVHVRTHKMSCVSGLAGTVPDFGLERPAQKQRKGGRKEGRKEGVGKSHLSFVVMIRYSTH